MQIEFQFYWENARTNMNRVMKLKPSGGCRTFLAAFVATLASVAQLFAANAVITWDNPADIVYGTGLSNTQLNAAFTNSDTGAQLTGTVTYTPSAGTYLNAGSQQALKVTFTPNGGQGVAGGSVDKTVFVNVAKAALTATAPSGTPEYGTGVAAFKAGLKAEDVTYSGFINNGVITDGKGSLSVVPTLKLEADATTKAGTSKPVLFDIAPAATNYTITTVNGTMTVSKKSLVFTLADFNKEYGETPIANDSNIVLGGGSFGAALPASGTGIGWQGTDKDNVAISQVHSVKVDSPVGAYDITVSLAQVVAGVLDNYDVQINNGSYTVNKRTLTINVTPGGGNVIAYGGDFPTFGATFSIDEGGSVFNIPDVAKNGDALKTSTGVLDVAETLNLPAANSNASGDAYDVTSSGGSAFGGNYNVVRVKTTLLINKTPLTINALDRTKITGVDLPGIASLQISFPDPSQLKFGDVASGILDPYPPKLKYSAAAYAPPLSADLSDGPSLKVGTYADAIEFDGAPTSTNYALTLDKGDLIVTLQPSQVTWAPEATTLTYGEALEAKHLNAKGSTQYLLAGVPTDLTGTITYEAKLGDNPAIPVLAGNNLNAGTWVITATFTPDPGQPVDFGPGTYAVNFTVNKAALKVTANEQTRVFGAVAFDKNNVKYEGFVLGDAVGGLTKAPTVADPSSAASNVGEYSIIASGGESSNYAFNYVSGKLKVTPAATAVTWDPEAAGVDVEKHITYGTALSTTPNTNAKGPDGVDGTITYDININDPRALTVPTHSVTATFTPTSGNYSKSASTKALNILRRSADVVPQGFDMVYGDDMPSISGTSDEANGGFLDGDGIVTTFKTDAIKGSDVGVYFITAEYEDTNGRLRNYTIKLSSGEENRINVNKAIVNIETVNKGSAVNDPQTTLALKLSGLKAEAAVLNGVELTAAQIVEAHGNKEIKIGDKTYNNNDSGLADSIKALNLLGKVFNADGFPTFTVPDFSNAVEKTFNINTVLDVKTDDGDGISIAGNYDLGTNASGEYSVGKATPTINWADSGLTYGEAIVDANLNATVTDARLLVKDKEGTFTYRIADGNGESAKGLKLPAGTHKLHVTYVPHADNANAFLSGTKTVTLTVAKADLDIHIPSITGYVYGDPLPRIAASELNFGTKVGDDLLRGFVNGDDSSIFDPANGGIQPVVAIVPNRGIADSVFSVAHSPADVIFGQLASSKNYNHNVFASTMAISRRPVTVRAADSVTTFGMSTPLGLEYDNLAPGETAENLTNGGFAFLSGQPNIATLAPQVYTVFANGAFGDNYVVTHATGSLTVAKAPATINVADTSASYDGTGKMVTVTTEPAGLATSVTYNGAPDLPVNAGTYAVEVNVSDVNYTGTFVSSLTIAPTSATVSLGDLSQNFDGTGKSVSVVTEPAGIAVAVTYNGNPAAPTQAGSYAVEASVSDPNFSGSAEGTLEIGKGVAQIALSNLSQVADGSAKAVGVSTSPAGLSTVVTYEGAATAPSAVGTYAVSVTVQSADYDGTAEGTLTILEAATISFDGLLATYTGDPVSPTITTSPAGLKVNVTYNKNPVVPHEAGTYEVVASIEDATYSGTAKALFEITKSSTATITFVESSLQMPWNNVKAPQVTTDPAGLDVRMTYNGSLTLPSTPGEYEVKAIINDRNVRGSKTATMVIGKSPQDITFPAIPNLNISGNPVILVLSATSNSGLPVKYIVLRGGATVDGNLLTISQPGLVSLTAQQLGNENYLPADEEVRSFEVTGTGVPLGAAQTEASLNDDGSVSLGVSGSPFESLSIYSASVVDAEFKPIVKIVLDADGKGSYNTASDADQRFFQVK
jgi:hypothetical protein